MSFKTIILAAGKGTRMKSKLPKVLHKVCSKEMINHVVDISKESGSTSTVVVVGHGADLVRERLSGDVEIVVQKEQLGTGHAVKMAEDYIDENDTVVVLCGDTPLIKADTIRNLSAFHKLNNCYTTVLTTEVEDPTGYGRVIRDNQGDLLKIVEQKDANEAELMIKEINSGVYCFNGKELKDALSEVKNDNAQGEYYLPDVIEIMKNKGLKVGAYNGATIDELMGVNSRVHLAKAEAAMRKRINTYHMDNGVTFINPDSSYIGCNVKIGKDTVIYPNVVIEGDSEIGEECEIMMGSSITNSKVGDRTVVKSSTLMDASVGSDTTVGPYAYLRPKANVGNHCKVGDFVEIKNANFGDGSKASHLSYIGDADVGKDVNVGCGVVFVNYDGKNKFRSIVKDGAFIGSNSNLIAPVNIEEKAYIATGSTITDSVPKDALAIARMRQTVKEHWVTKRDKKDKEKAKKK